MEPLYAFFIVRNETVPYIKAFIGKSLLGKRNKNYIRSYSKSKQFQGKYGTVFAFNMKNWNQEYKDNCSWIYRLTSFCTSFEYRLIHIYSDEWTTDTGYYDIQGICFHYTENNKAKRLEKPGVGETTIIKESSL